MLFFENFSLAVSAILANKIRAALTMLGIIIGIASVIAIMTISSSMTAASAEQMSSRGADKIQLGVRKKSVEFFFRRGGGPDRDMKKSDYIKDEMIRSLNTEFGERIRAVGVSQSAGSGVVRKGSDYANVDITGINYDGYQGEKLTLLSGREFKSQDFAEGRRTCIVSDYLCNNMFGGNYKNAVGKEIVAVVNKRYYHYKIVGVYKFEKSDRSFDTSSEKDTRTTLYVPLKAALNQSHNTDGYSSITVFAADIEDATALVSDMEDFLNYKYYRNNEDYNISGFANQTMVENVTERNNTIAVVMSVIAGISLLVGGIGVMNIMLVSIAERTREIGTRKALGAKNSSIQLQFIMESVLLCCLGGIIGVILGIIIGMVSSKVMGYPGSINMMSVLVSFGFSTFIGVFFGFYPAARAARLNPIDALRYE